MIVSTYITGPELATVTVVGSNGVKATAQHPERYDRSSLHFMPNGPGEKRYLIVLPRPLTPRVAQRMADLKAQKSCAGRGYIEWSDRSGKWLRRSPL